MSKWSGLAFPAATIGAALLITVFAPRRYAPAAPSKAWEPGEAVAWAQPTEADQFRRLEGERLAVLARYRARTEVAESLVRGDLSLDQAAERFEKLNAANDVTILQLRRWRPGATDVELVRWQVVQAVRGIRSLAPVEVAAALSRLEAEIARRFSRPSPERPGPGAH